ncbi:hypothetical protein [Microvirga tunisiensis]|uniref:Uncharacterized protein n=1 Tax=Microvirga tunisiensis TaxID=2108360 RepID=A0A5N7MT05_9HYPH|nr:hypothetical protein [Microvirga tunisiensis]MPR12185.1 hypothetical protein [Microvirga tunisiensis]MPR30131.1 hypothetical protein [Microvirga tunisiensis]
MYARPRFRPLSPTLTPGVPELFVFKRFLDPIRTGSKKQLLVSGKRTPTPSKDEPFVLVYKDDETGNRIPFARGISDRYSSGVCLDFDSDYHMVDYQEWDGEDDGSPLYKRDAIERFAKVDGTSIEEALGRYRERDAFARAEGFVDWKALAQFHSRNHSRFRGWVIYWEGIELLEAPASLPKAA